MGKKMGNYIYVPRSIFFDESLDDGKYSRREAFLDLVQRASYDPEKTIIIKGARVIIKRGQLPFSLRKLADKWGWGKDKVAKTLEDFQAERRIDIFKDSLTSIISIVNYDMFQGGADTTADTEADTTADTNKDADKDTDKDNNKNNKESKTSRIKQKKTSNDVKESLVFPFTSETFMATWDVLCREDKWKKKTVNALQLSLDKLGKYDERFAIMLMQDAIEHGWQGVVFQNTDERYAAWQTANPPVQQETEEPEPTIPFKPESPWTHGVFYTLADFQATEEGREQLEKFKGQWEEDVLNEEHGLLRFMNIWEPLSDHPEYIEQNKEKYHAVQ